MWPLLICSVLFPAPDFERDIRPILTARCTSCHGEAKQRASLRLDRRSFAFKGGESGAVLQPGQAEASLLWQRVVSTDEGERMPPSGKPLTDQEQTTLRWWLNSGAHWPEDDLPETPQHWAFVPVRRPAVPAGADHPIDALIRARLAPEGLKPSPEADRRTLIRRLKFDLLGLPPTPEEVDAFVADPAPDAYERLVERYLASPHFGERWARHWLDAVRFAESNGFETNLARANAWHYRDWVIRSLNQDLPYDQFVRQQLAGDQFGNDEATGFLVAGAVDIVKSPDPVLTAQHRSDELHDMVSTTGATFLGLTVGCSRCHDHKFDPISMRDYYSMVAVFSGVQHGERAVRGPDAEKRARQAEATAKALEQLQVQLVELEPLADPSARSPRRLAVNSQQNVERFAPVPAKWVRFTILAANQHEPCLDELEVFTAGPQPINVALEATPRTSSNRSDDSPIHRLEHINDGQYGNGRSWIPKELSGGWVELELPQVQTIDRIVWGRDREGRYKDRTPTRYLIEVAVEPDQWQLVATSHDRLPMGNATAIPPALQADADAQTRWNALVKQRQGLEQRLAELRKQSLAYIGRFMPAPVTHRLHRGDVTQKREAIPPGTLEEFPVHLELTAETPEDRRRLALANWIVHPENPLTARVLVNRLWHHHFGTGIVDTPSDFGRNGGQPSHPALLDWLASELMKPTARSGSAPDPWSMKHLHRLIVTSATYRQSSHANPEGIARDAQSRLLWRYPPRRLEAEPIRDAILAVSGKLDTTMYGPGFDLFEPNTNYVKVYTPKAKFGPAEWRRMVYQSKPRMQPDDTFGTFDCPDGGQIAPKRNVSTTALQALSLLNSPFATDQADHFAQRVTREAGTETAAQVTHAFRLAFQRKPTATEASAAVELVDTHGLAALCRALYNANEFVYIP